MVKLHYSTAAEQQGHIFFLNAINMQNQGKKNYITNYVLNMFERPTAKYIANNTII